MEKRDSYTISGTSRDRTVAEVTQANLEDMARETAVETFSIAAPALESKDTAILGRLKNLQGHSGIRVHATDTVEAHDLNASWDMGPKFSIAILLEGQLNIWFDDFPLQLGGPNGVTGHAWSLTSSVRVTRKSRKGTRVRKVVISFPHSWLDETLCDPDLPNNNLDAFANTHMAHTTWQPSAHAVALAEQILNPSLTPSALQALSAESRAIEIVREALFSIIDPEAPDSDVQQNRTREQVRAQTIRRYIQDNIDRNPSLGETAHDLGMSVASMQAAFKLTYGTTIAEFGRDLRLQRARTLMERDGISVSEAAYAAGYSSPANFSTAFKQLFGMPPSRVKD